MTSNITFTTIDENFPVAGEDNDSQGFRSNFDVIKTALETASNEISDLQAQTVKVDENNDFDGTEIQNAVLSSASVKFNDAGTTTSSITVDYVDGQYQTVTVVPGVTQVFITLDGWRSSENCETMRIELIGSGPESASVIFQTSGQLKLISTWPSEQLLGQVAQLYEFWTYDGGNTVYGNYLGEFNNA